MRPLRASAPRRNKLPLGVPTIFVTCVLLNFCNKKCARKLLRRSTVKVTVTHQGGVVEQEEQTSTQPTPIDILETDVLLRV